MARNTLAPWAEVVPEAGPMTIGELLALPDDTRWRYELVEGRLVRMAPPGGTHGEVAGLLHIALGSWVMAHGLGRVLAAETGFQVGPKSALAADVAFVRMDRIPPPGPERDRYWRLASDVVGEVASPGQTRDELEAKARTWLAAGVRLVWNVWPKRQQVDVWHADATGTPQLMATLKVSASDALDGLDVLPGFTYPLVDLFA